ncbi:hypothetical protein SAMN05216436_10264 [bacterium A37T11]|nr:hypothetical protein SAMN05216436_10264 [bacterium A37T11]
MFINRIKFTGISGKPKKVGGANNLIVFPACKLPVQKRYSNTLAVYSDSVYIVNNILLYTKYKKVL